MDEEQNDERIFISVRELQDFKESKFWRVVEERLDEFLEDIRTELENPDNDLGLFKHLSGSAFAIRRMKAIPNVLIDEAEDREVEMMEEKQKEGKDES